MQKLIEDILHDDNEMQKEIYFEKYIEEGDMLNMKPLSR